MHKIVDLQPAYEKAYQLITVETIQFVSKHLNSNDFKTIQEMINETKKILGEQILLITSKRNHVNYPRTDLFTHEIICAYNEQIIKYKSKNITYFLNDHLLRIQTDHIATVHEYPLNYHLSAKEIAELIAKHNALEDINAKLIYIEIAENETVHSYIKNLTTSDLVDLRLKESLKWQKKNTDDAISPSSRRSKFSKLKNITANPTTAVQIKADIDEKETKINPHARIFKNHECYLFFESLRSDVTKFPLANFSFIFRRMQKDGFIFKYVQDGEYRDFLQNISIEIDKTKLLDYCKTDSKEKHYNAKKALFKAL